MMRRGFLLLFLTFGAAAAETNSVTISTNGFASFNVISQRNIFNPNRSARGGARRETGDEPKATRVDSFSLVGTMLYEKGELAFFDSSTSEYRKVLKAGDSIAGYKINEVASSGVKLEGKEKTLDLAVGQQMRREDQGEWKVTGKPVAETVTTASGSDKSSSSGGDDDEVIKRLMKKREEEMNK